MSSDGFHQHFDTHGKSPNTAIAIPLAGEDFGQFIAGLLGQRRTIERSFADRRFAIDMNWLINLDQIIKQRLASQNDAQLVSFSARLYFSNGKIITLGSQNDFLTFNDISTEMSVGVDMRWAYLIQFPLSKLPEKQEIRFFAFTKSEILERKPENKSSFLSFTTDPTSERLGFSVQFTDITWGEDLSTHISNYILSHTEAISRWRKALRRARTVFITPLLLALGMLITTMSMVTSINSTTTQLRGIFGPLENLSERLSPDEKLNFLVRASIARLQQEIPIFSTIWKPLLLFAIVFGIIFLLYLRKASVLKLNRFSSQYADNIDKHYNFVVYGIFAALVVGIIAGIISTGLYDWLKSSLS